MLAAFFGLFVAMSNQCAKSRKPVVTVFKKMHGARRSAIQVLTIDGSLPSTKRSQITTELGEALQVVGSEGDRKSVV